MLPISLCDYLFKVYIYLRHVFRTIIYFTRNEAQNIFFNNTPDSDSELFISQEIYNIMSLWY